jgi:predicted TIM-barrel fold metal-dependent hydrolase
VANKEEAEHLAKIANDYMAAQVKKNPKRFSGFASLSMHDPKQAAQELRRAVKELGLVGCMYIPRGMHLMTGSTIGSLQDPMERQC